MKQQIVTETVRGLDDFYFTIQDYALDGGKRVIAQANEHLHQRHNVGVVPEDCLSSIVQAKYRSMIMESVSWIRLPAEGATEISFSRDNIVVSGKVIIEPKKVHVELSFAGKIYSKDSILLALTPRIYTKDPFIGSPANSEGEECAKVIFLKLYYEALFRKD